MTEQDKQENPAGGVRDSALIAATQHYVDSLHAAGVETIIIAFAITEEPKGEGAYRVMGNATLILNLVCAIVKKMIPEDFKRLLAIMLKGEYFAAQRGENIQPMDPKKVN